MINGLQPNYNVPVYSNTVNTNSKVSYNQGVTYSLSNPIASNYTASFSTVLNGADIEKYNYILNYLSNVAMSKNGGNLTPSQQMEFLLKSGKLLNKSTHDGSTTLDNLYKIITTPRAHQLNPTTLLTNTLDILCNPKFVTQNFGNLPSEDEKRILDAFKPDSNIKKHPELIDVMESGVCPAASVEVNVADKYPSEYARWIEGLSGTSKKVDLNCKMDVISETNPLETMQIVELFETKRLNGFNWHNVKLEVKADDNAYVRANVQEKDWDYGERNVADTLFQSAVMQLGSQNTYSSLTDTHNSKFNASDKGLIEIEKTYVESLIKNKNISSLIYQDIDEDKNLLGYNCDFSLIKKHLTDTIDSGDDVIIGIVLTNETAGVTKEPGYNPQIDGAPNKIINGHEITVTDYKVMPDGKVKFICVDTDDDDPNFVEYDEDYLLPKIHHGGYPTDIVRNDLAKFNYLN